MRQYSVKHIYENFERFNPEELSQTMKVALLAFHAKKIKDRDLLLKTTGKDSYLFATTFLYTKNEHTAQIERFPDFDYLRDVVFPTMNSEGNFLWEKSRRMMISISFCAQFFFQWLCDDLFLGAMTSRGQSKVDDGGGASTWDSLFGKMRFMYDKLAEMNPFVIEHFLGSVPRSDRLFRKLAIENTKTNSTIIGEAPTPNCLTGGGFTKILVDEAARVPNMVSIHANLIMAARNVHYVSYPNGKNNTFYEVRHTEGNYGFTIKRIIWSMYPGRDQKWYEAESKKMSVTQRGMLLDISYSESTEAKVWYEFREGNRVNNLPFNPKSVILWWDFGSTDATAVVFANVTREIVGKELRLRVRLKTVVQDWNTDYEKVAKAVRQKLKEIGFRGSTFSIRCIGGYDVKNTQVATGKTLGWYYLEEGFNIEATPHHDTKTVLDEINVMMREGDFFVDSDCDLLTDAIDGWEWPTNRHDGKRKPGVTQPEHSQFSHIGKAIEYGMAAVVGNTEAVLISSPAPAPVKQKTIKKQRPRAVVFRRGVLHKR